MVKSGSNTACSKRLETSRKLVLLAPGGVMGDGGSSTGTMASRYYELLSAVQRFRGRTYLIDGALRLSELDSEGRHKVDADHRSWHLVALDEDGEVCGCSRYRVHPRNTHFSELSVGRAALARSPIWGTQLEGAVERLRDVARQRGIDFVEVGGWAISEDLRGTTEALRIALGTYSLAHRLGGCIGITTATVRHRSAAVLRKIGGSTLDYFTAELPSYFDPEYDCEMQILKFDSAAPNAKMIPWIDQLGVELNSAEIVRPFSTARPDAQRPWHNPVWGDRAVSPVAMPA